MAQTSDQARTSVMAWLTGMADFESAPVFTRTVARLYPGSVDLRDEPQAVAVSVPIDADLDLPDRPLPQVSMRDLIAEVSGRRKGAVDLFFGE